jgi:hypothetical protein
MFKNTYIYLKLKINVLMEVIFLISYFEGFVFDIASQFLLSDCIQPLIMSGFSLHLTFDTCYRSNS